VSGCENANGLVTLSVLSTLLLTVLEVGVLGLVFVLRNRALRLLAMLVRETVGTLVDRSIGADDKDGVDKSVGGVEGGRNGDEGKAGDNNGDNTGNVGSETRDVSGGGVVGVEASGRNGEDGTVVITGAVFCVGESVL